MKVSDYMVEIIRNHGVTEMFGIPGVGCGHFMNSMLGTDIKSHLVYNEQGAAFAACGYAQASKKVGFAYTTAGPGGTNLLTGIANAYADSIPVIFMVGEKDLSSLRGERKVRQIASQEVDIVSVTESVTKWSYRVTDKSEIRYVLEKAFYVATSGRPGPVLLDIPSDIARDEVEPNELVGFEIPKAEYPCKEVKRVAELIRKANKPLFLVGNGAKQNGITQEIMEIAINSEIPVVSSLIAFDVYPNSRNYIGFIGLDGALAANKIIDECDLLVTFGSRLNFKQICNDRLKFAKNAQIIRIDCDAEELEYALRDEIRICADIVDFVPILAKELCEKKDSSWLRWCQELKAKSPKRHSLNEIGDKYMDLICKKMPENINITVDVGSHRRWFMTQVEFKEGQGAYQSSGLASMGYALPAAIGTYYANNKNTICIDGDGGIMMNLQELQVINREHLPITVIVFNNSCLGDIMEFQKKVFPGAYFMTTEDSGYLAANYEKIAEAFSMKYYRIDKLDQISEFEFDFSCPQFIEVVIPSNT